MHGTDLGSVVPPSEEYHGVEVLGRSCHVMVGRGEGRAVLTEGQGLGYRVVLNLDTEGGVREQCNGHAVYVAAMVPKYSLVA